MQPLILASASLARRELLEQLKLPFSVVPSEVDESAHEELDPAKRPRVLARLKALDVYRKRPESWIIGCDTVVQSADGQMLEKPVDGSDAERMLLLHSGNAAIVRTGICLVRPDGAVFEDLSASRVHFRTLDEEDIAWWLERGYWKGCAGGFFIEGPGQLLIERIEGDWAGIIGLPVSLLAKLAHRAGARLKL